MASISGSLVVNQPMIDGAKRAIRAPAAVEPISATREENL